MLDLSATKQPTIFWTLTGLSPTIWIWNPFLIGKTNYLGTGISFLKLKIGIQNKIVHFLFSRERETVVEEFDHAEQELAEYLEKLVVFMESITEIFEELKVLFGKLMVVLMEFMNEDEWKDFCMEMAEAKSIMQNYADTLKIYLQIFLLEEIEPMESDRVPGFQFLNTSSALVDSVFGLYNAYDQLCEQK